jgi:hypothetical protein
MGPYLGIDLHRRRSLPVRGIPEQRAEVDATEIRGHTSEAETIWET